MSSIKININSKFSGKRTSTTFTEMFARFFLHAWQLIRSSNENPDVNWLELLETNDSYQNRLNVSKALQISLNELITFCDGIYGDSTKRTVNRWSRENIEKHLLIVIFLSNKGSLELLEKTLISSNQ